VAGLNVVVFQCGEPENYASIAPTNIFRHTCVGEGHKSHTSLSACKFRVSPAA